MLLYRSFSIALALFCACATVRRPRASAVDNLFDNYLQAVGGQPAVLAITSRITDGELVAGNNRAPLEIYQSAPDRFLRVLRNAQVALSENGFDGTTGWSRNDDQRRTVSGPELGQFRREYGLHRPVSLREEYAALTELSDTTLEGASLARVQGTTSAGSVEVLYFNRTTALLAGWDQTIRGVLIETRYSDYRTVQGVRVPFRVERRRPGFRWAEQAAAVRHNVPIDPRRFSPPDDAD